MNQPRYVRVYSCKYSQMLGCHNNWILMNFLDDGTDESQEIDNIYVQAR